MPLAKVLMEELPDVFRDVVDEAHFEELEELEEMFREPLEAIDLNEEPAALEPGGAGGFGCGISPACSTRVFRCLAVGSGTGNV